MPADEPATGPRPAEQRKREALHRLTHDIDVWCATASPAGEPCLVPLAFWWDAPGTPEADPSHGSAGASGDSGGEGSAGGPDGSDDSGSAGSATGTGSPGSSGSSHGDDRGSVWLATRITNPTGRNLLASGKTRLCFGHTRDVVLMHGTARVYRREDLPPGVGDAFAAKDGWDPRKDHESYVFFQVVPEVMQVWGTVAEMNGRTLMRDGKWLV